MRELSIGEHLVLRGLSMGKVNSIEDFFKTDLPESEKRRLELQKKIAETEEEKRMIEESLKQDKEKKKELEKRMIELETRSKIAREQIEKIENYFDNTIRDIINELGEGRLKELLEFGIMKKVFHLSNEEINLIVDVIKASLKRL